MPFAKNALGNEGIDWCLSSLDGTRVFVVSVRLSVIGLRIRTWGLCLDVPPPPPYHSSGFWILI